MIAEECQDLAHGSVACAVRIRHQGTKLCGCGDTSGHESPERSQAVGLESIEVCHAAVDFVTLPLSVMRRLRRDQTLRQSCRLDLSALSSR